MYDEYDLVRRLTRVKGGSKSVEIGTIVSDNPLKFRIGDCVYDSRAWNVFLPVIEESDIEEKEGLLDNASVDCGISRITQLKYKSGKCKERKAKIKFNKGDLIAIQQLDGDTSFLILCKIERVI